MRTFSVSIVLLILLAAPAGAGEPLPAAERTLRVILAPVERVVLSAEITSTVEEVRRELGQGFTEGEPLVVLDARIYEASRDKAAAQLASAKAQLQSMESLLVEGGASVAEVEKMRMQVAVAEANLVVAKIRVETCTIRAPFDGKVVRVATNRHEYVQPGQELVEILDDSILRAQFLAPAALRNELTIGREVPVRILESGRVVTARVSHVGKMIDPSSSTVKVLAEIDNADGALSAGLRAEVAIAGDGAGDDR